MPCTTAQHKVRSETVTSKNLWNSGKTALLRLTDTLAAWRDRSRQRQMLLALDTYQLKDIGISHADAQKEANKPFWRE